MLGPERVRERDVGVEGTRLSQLCGAPGGDGHGGWSCIDTLGVDRRDPVPLMGSVSGLPWTSDMFSAGPVSLGAR